MRRFGGMLEWYHRLFVDLRVARLNSRLFFRRLSHLCWPPIIETTQNRRVDDPAMALLRACPSKIGSDHGLIG
jgi:hypothetical protein